MTTNSSRLAATAAAFALALTVSGCSSDAGDADQPATTASAGRDVPAAAEQLMRQYGLAGMDPVTVIDHLDRLGGDDRPADLTASVRPGELVLAADGEEFQLDIPDDRFYLSIAPYVDQTHECFHHSLTTCTGELDAEEVQVEIVDETNGEVLVDETTTTFDNGFVGFWLPRGIEGTLRVSYDGRTGQADFTTDDEAPTCLTSLRLT
jgi:hypothetical protein